MLRIVLLLCLGVLALLLLDRLGLWLEARGWLYWRRRKPQGSSLGSTFLELQRIFESDKSKHLIEAKHDAGKPPDTDAGKP